MEKYNQFLVGYILLWILTFAFPASGLIAIAFITTPLMTLYSIYKLCTGNLHWTVWLGLVASIAATVFSIALLAAIAAFS